MKNASTLEQEYERILSDIKEAPKAEVKEEIKEPQEEVEKELEDEGVHDSTAEGVQDQTAETSEEEQPKKEEGDKKVPSELEEELKGLDPEIKNAILNADQLTREAQINAFKKMRASFDKKQTELGLKRKIAESVESVFNKHGLNVNQNLDKIERLIEFERKLNEDPKAAINSIKAMFKIEDETNEAPKLKIDEDSLTENEKLLYQQAQEANKKIEQLLAENKRIKELTEREEQDKILAEILDFKNAKNEDGSLKNPYFDDLVPEMERLALIYPNERTEKLYNRALRLNDDLYAKSLEDIKEQERQKILKQKEEALKKAKSINSQSVKSSSTRISEKKSLGDIFDEIISKSA